MAAMVGVSSSAAAAASVVHSHGRGSALLALAMLLLPGCSGWVTAFNECNAELGEYLGRTTVELDLRKTTVRTAEAPAGNLAVDALFEAAQTWCSPTDPSRPCPVAAVENAGGIRASTSCGDRESLATGPLHDRDIRDMLPFDSNTLVVTAVTGEELWLMLERSVALLGQVGEAGAGGFFLQVHGLSFEVDCSRPAQTLNFTRDRITRRGERVDPARVTVGGQALSLTATYVLATNSFVAGANDGFLSLAQRNPDDSVITDGAGRPLSKPFTTVVVDGASLPDQESVRRYIRSRGVVAPRVEGRIRLLPSCTPQQ